MSISGVGSRCTYIYNSQTKKLITKDGKKDAFVNYFNGTALEEDKESLNGFDAKRKRDIENMIMFFSSEETGNFINDGNETEYEISDEIVDAITSNYSINGKKVFTAYSVGFFTYVNNDILNKKQPYKTHQPKEYDPVNNSVNIAVGDVFDFGNGYKLTVKEDYIYGEGYGKGEYDQKLKQLVWGLNALIHFADQQWFAAMIDRESTPMLLALLNELGVDTSKEFVINGTRCEVKDGRISEVGNKFAIPSAMQNTAIERYEELLYRPLSEKR